MLNNFIKYFEKHLHITYTITFLLAATIFVISGLEFTYEIPGGNITFNSLVYHFSIYFILNFFITISITNKVEKYTIVAIIVSIIYGITDEIHQIYVPGRVFSYFDMFVNANGAVLSSFIYILSKRKKSF